MELHRGLGDIELVCDVTVRQAVRDESEHGALTWRQLLEERLRRGGRPGGRARGGWRGGGDGGEGSGGLMTASTPAGISAAPVRRSSSRAWPAISIAPCCSIRVRN